MSLIRPQRHARRKREKSKKHAFRPRTTAELFRFRRRSYFSETNRSGSVRWKGCPQFGHGTRFRRIRTLGWSNPGPIYRPMIDSLEYKAKKAKEQSKKKRVLRNRFLHKRSQTPGPGTYKLPSDFSPSSWGGRKLRKRRKSRREGVFPFTTSSTRLPKLRKSASPGPGCYSLPSDFKGLVRSNRGKREIAAKRRNTAPNLRQHIGSRSDRFKVHIERNPGPGSYDLEDILNFVHHPYGKV